MKKNGLWLFVAVCAVTAAMMILQACATAPGQKTAGNQASPATPGLYVNKAPAFSVSYPKKWVPDKKQQPTEVLRVVNPTIYKIPSMVVDVSDLKTGATLDNAAADFLKGLAKAVPGTKRFKILSEKQITLNDGTPAVLINFSWTWKDGVTKLQSAALLVYKEGKSISVLTTTVFGGFTSLKELTDMVLTFKFL